MLCKKDIMSYEIKEVNEILKKSNYIVYNELIEKSIGSESNIYKILGDVNRSILQYLYSDSIVGGLGYYELDNAFVIYDGCVIFDKKIISSQQINITDYNRHILNHFLPNEFENCIEIDDVSIVLYGPGYLTWGHWLVDFFPRIFIIEQYGYNINSFKWILPMDAPHYVDFFLEKIGIMKENIIKFNHKNEYIKCKKVFIVKNFILGGAMHPFMRVFLFWINKKIQTENKNSKIKTYISRKKFKTNRIIENNIKIEHICESYGYNIIHPEELSVLEQIKIFRESVSVFGEYGSGMHTSIFSPEGIFVTCLRSNLNSFGFMQNGLCNLRKQKISYIFGETKFIDGKEIINIHEDDIRYLLDIIEKRIFL